MKRQFIIDCFPESAQRYKSGYAIVIVDVLRASTTIVSALSKGFRILPVQTTDEAFILADGEVIASGPPEDIAASKIARRIYLGDEFRL